MRNLHTAASMQRAHVGIDPDTRMPRVEWIDDTATRLEPSAPPYACSLLGFDDATQRDARLAEAIAARDNATVHSGSSPAVGGPHVILTVHLDRPTTPGTRYAEAVTISYAGRGPMGAPPEGDGWEPLPNGEGVPYWGMLCRQVPGGREYAWQVGGMQTWLEPDLARDLDAAMARLGLRRAGGDQVVVAYPGDEGVGRYHAPDVRRALDDVMNEIVFVSWNRQEARDLASDPAVVRMLSRLATGCIVLWAENVGNGKEKSYQLRPGCEAPARVSGETVHRLYRLGVVAPFWERLHNGGFHQQPWSLVRLTDRGRMLLSGDVNGAVVGARHWSDLPCSVRKVVAIPLVDAVATYAATLSPAQREAILDGGELPRAFDVGAAIRRGGELEAMAAVLTGILSGRATVTEAGRFKLVPARVRSTRPAPVDGHGDPATVSERRGR